MNVTCRRAAAHHGVARYPSARGPDSRWHGALLAFAFVWSPADVTLGDSVRIMYVHVPAAILAFATCLLTTVASAMWLRRRTEGWWVLGGAAGRGRPGAHRHLLWSPARSGVGRPGAPGGNGTRA